MSDKILYKGKTYGNTLGTNSAILIEEQEQEGDVTLYIKEDPDVDTKQVLIAGGGRATYGNIGGHTLVVQGLKMTYADDKSNCINNGWIRTTDIYTSFDIDIGGLTENFGYFEIDGTNKPYIPMTHYEIKPLVVKNNTLGFYINNNEENIKTCMSVGSSETYTSYRYYLSRIISLANENYIYSGNKTKTSIEDSTNLRFPLLFSVGSNITDSYMRESCMPYICTDEEIPVNKDYFVFGVNTKHLPYYGVYFLVDEIVPTGKVFVYNKTNGEYSNDKYKYGYVFCRPFFLNFGIFTEEQVEENGFVLNEGGTTCTDKDGVNLYYKKNSDNTYLIYDNNNSAYLSYYSSSPSHHNDQKATSAFSLIIPFANEAERDFACGMTQNLEYLTPEEYERLGSDTNG